MAKISVADILAQHWPCHSAYPYISLSELEIQRQTCHTQTRRINTTTICTLLVHYHTTLPYAHSDTFSHRYCCCCCCSVCVNCLTKHCNTIPFSSPISPTVPPLNRLPCKK